MRVTMPLSLAGALLIASCAGPDPVSTDLDTRDPGSHTVAFSQDNKAPGCRPDAKLLGRILISTEDVPGTWWYLTREGFDAAGVTDYKAFIEAGFGQSFATLADAIAALVDAVNVVDRNGNGYVCPHSIPGTRTNLGDPNFSFYFFRTYDDSFGK